MMHSEIQNKQVRQSGFSLIELMISMAIGLFMMAGVFTVYINTRDSQRMVEDQVAMMDDARFALEVMSYDLRHAGNFGRLNEPELVDPTLIQPGDVANDCFANWAVDRLNWVYAYDSVADDGARDISSCLTGYVPGTSDILEVRYGLGTPVPNAVLRPDRLYLNGDVHGSTYFIGTAPPDATKMNFQAVANAYYISSYAYTPGDGIPSLRRVSLQPGPEVTDELILPGVEEFQVMMGVDVDHDGTVDTYNDPVAKANVGQANEGAMDARSMQLWLVVRSTDRQPDLDTSVSFDIAGQVVDYPNDGYRRFMLSSVVALRNKNFHQ